MIVRTLAEFQSNPRVDYTCVPLMSNKYTLSVENSVFVSSKTACVPVDMIGDEAGHEEV